MRRSLLDRARLSMLSRYRQKASSYPGLVVLLVLGSVAGVLLMMRGLPQLQLQWRRGDFWVFYQAATALAGGHDPYSSPYYHSLPAFTRFVQLFTVLPCDVAYDAWLIVLAAAQAVAFLTLASRYGYRTLITVVALSPALLLALVVGQPIALLILGCVAALNALDRDRPVLAGAVLAVAWLKPQIMLPATLFLVAFRPRMCFGFVLGSILVLGPPSLPAWLHNVAAFPTYQQSVQESLAGIWPHVFGSAHAG